MNFDKITTAELRDLMPQKENGWEYKDAMILLDKNKLKEELEIQTSAFANSGGGYLVFGVRDSDQSFQPCELKHGRQDMEEYLANLIESSVEYALFGAKVYRINFTNDPTKAVFLVEYPDSPRAPHQAKNRKIYYWRQNFKCEAAPHYFLDALRNRPVKATLDIPKIAFRLDPLERAVTAGPTGVGEMFHLSLVLRLLVKNTSFISTDTWCIHTRSEGNSTSWQRTINAPMDITMRPPIQDMRPLLPEEEILHSFAVQTILPTDSWQQFGKQRVREAFQSLRLHFRPVSHNFVGRDVSLNCGEDDLNLRRAQLEEQLEKLKIPGD